MGKTIIETKSLIDSDSDSVDEADAHMDTDACTNEVVFTVPGTTVCPTLSTDRSATVLTSTNISFTSEDQEKVEVSSDIPSLADASDYEETQSQASVSSSLISYKENKNQIEVQDKGQGGLESLLQQVSSPESQVSKDSQPWVEGICVSSKESVVHKVISEDTSNSLNTIQTSNKDIQGFSKSYDSTTPKLSTHTEDEQQPEEEDDPSKQQKEITSGVRCGGVFETSIQYVTEFFSCSTPNVTCSTNEILGHDISQETQSITSNSKSTVCTSNRTPEDGTKLDYQLQTLQTCIELDILNIMGCSAEGAQSLIHSLGQSIFCHQCQCASSNSSGGKGEFCEQCKDVTEPTVNKPKIRNRNVYVREKASKRIKRLRQGGLSRHFSLAPVYTFLAEEIDVVQEEVATPTPTNPGVETNAPKNGKGSLIPLASRPRSLGEEERQTSLGGASTLHYEPTILATRSHEFPGNKDIQKTGGRETQSDTGAMFGSNVGQSLLTRIFKPNHSRCSPSISKQESIPDLYYDSDPGTRDSNRITDPSQLRKVVAGENQRRSRSIGIINNVATNFRRFNADYFTNRKSLLQSLDINTFDINDPVLIAQLIRELITSSFSFIWHPNKAVKDWSGSYNAPPHRIKAWFEMGSCLKRTLLQPKFVWRSNDNVRHTSRQSKVQSIHSPESIELLNIVRVVVPSQINRQIHPFVKKDCVFMIVTNTEEESFFEAATKDERDKFVFAFKVMVARLASKIIVGDKDVFDEFFTPLGMTKKKRRRRKKERKTTDAIGVFFNGEKKQGPEKRKPSATGSVYDMGELKEDNESDSFSVSSENSGFCRAIVGSVDEESNRQDELWGS